MAKRKIIAQADIASGYNTLGLYGSSDRYYVNSAEHIGVIKGNIIDIGCGYGKFLKEVKYRNPLVKMHGIDICETAVEHCVSEGINARVANVEDIPFNDNYFDCAIMSMVIEHVIDQKKALAEVNRILKTGGLFLLTTDNVWWLWCMSLKNIMMPWKPKYTRKKQPVNDEFSYRRIRKMVEEAGFSVIKRMKSGPISAGERFVGKYDWSIFLYKRHWLLCRKQ
ncbi:MAG: methyltransferase domain-containing protein [Candidatus Auribacterota bacterium]